MVRFSRLLGMVSGKSSFTTYTWGFPMVWISRVFAAFILVFAFAGSAFALGGDPPPPPPESEDELLGQLADLQNSIRMLLQEHKLLISGRGGYGFAPPAFVVDISFSSTIVGIDFSANDNEDHFLRFEDPTVLGIIVGIRPGERTNIVFSAPQIGTYTFFCDAPGHRARGEEGRMHVRPIFKLRDGGRYAVVIDPSLTPGLVFLDDLFGISFNMISVGGRFKEVEMGSLFQGFDPIFFSRLEPHGKELSTTLTLKAPQWGIRPPEDASLITFEADGEAEVLISRVTANNKDGLARSVILDIVPVTVAAVTSQEKLPAFWGALKRQ